MIDFNNSIGSMWRKWDLHIHSDASDGKMTCEQIIMEAKKKGIDVIALTDHHTAKNIDVMLECGDKNGISVIPGIEFRTDKGKYSVHLIALFPRIYKGHLITSKLLQEVILSKLDLSESEIIQKGKNKLKTKCSEEKAFKEGMFLVQANLEKICDVVHKELGGLIIIHAGSKSSGLEKEISHDGKPGVTKENSMGPIKEEWFEKEYIDICEVKNFDEAKFYLEKFNCPSIIASDAHDLKEVGQKFTWIKADPTFEGLRQIIFEPESRISLKNKPEILGRIENSPTKFIKSIVINNILNMEDSWFDKFRIEFNPELVAIIGNKGSGKSAMLDILGLLGSSLTYDYYSFLHKEKFTKYPIPAKHFKSILEWQSGDTESKNLNDRPNKFETEKVKYIPQNYLEKLCTYINSEGEEDEFQKQLKQVIYSHVPIEKRENEPTLDELEDRFTEVIQKEIRTEQNEVKKINDKIIKLDIKSTDNYLRTLEDKLEKKKKELNNHEKIKPNEVIPPINVSKDSTLNKLTKEINAKDTQKKQITKEIGDIREKCTNLNISVTNLKNFQRDLDLFRNQFKDLKNSYSEQIKIYDLNFDEILEIKYERNLISEKIKSYENILLKLNMELNVNNNNSKLAILKIVETQIAKIKNQLDKPSKDYQIYIEKLKQWDDKRKEIIGNKNLEGTSIYLEEEIKYIKNNLKNDINKKRTERNTIVRKILQKKLEIIESYSELYKPVEEFIEENKVHNEEYQINFTVELILKGFSERFIKYINQNKIGSFFGKDSGMQKLNSIIEKVNFNNSDSVIKFLNELIKNLDYDTRDNSNFVKNEITKQIRETELGDFYSFLFGLDYLEANYKLKLGDKELNELSPGEKGALLLIFYLLIDKDDSPLLIDQPEENLDNESVYNILVEYIKKAKRRRQIFIVTHNPNLAVVCDAEQIITVNIDKKNSYKFSAVSGSIENPVINKNLVRILEGTMKAFSLRDKKYIITKRLSLE